MHAAGAGSALPGSRSAGVGLFDSDCRLSRCFGLCWYGGGALYHQGWRFTFESASDEDSKDNENASHQSTLQAKRFT